MASRQEDEQIDEQRHRLGGLLALTHERVVTAANLLSHRAVNAPRSAEAEAFAVLMEAIRSIDRWILDAGGLVGVKPLHGKDGNGQTTDAGQEAQKPAAGHRPDLAAGGEAGPRQAGPPVPD